MEAGQRDLRLRLSLSDDERLTRLSVRTLGPSGAKPWDTKAYAAKLRAERGEVHTWQPEGLQAQRGNILEYIIVVERALGDQLLARTTRRRPMRRYRLRVDGDEPRSTRAGEWPIDRALEAVPGRARQAFAPHWSETQAFAALALREPSPLPAGPLPFAPQGEGAACLKAARTQVAKALRFIGFEARGEVDLSSAFAMGKANQWGRAAALLAAVRACGLQAEALPVARFGPAEPWALDHMVLKVGEAWVDPVCDWCPSGTLPWYSAGRPFVGGRVPSLPSPATTRVLRHEGALDDKGGLRVEVVQRVGGQQRRSAEDDPTERLGKWAKRWWRRAKASGFQAKGAEDRVTLQWSRYAQAHPDRMELPLSILANWTDRLFREGARRAGVHVRTPLHVRDQLVLTLPEGFEVAYVPPDQRAEEGLFRWTCSFELSGRRLKVERHLAVARGQMPAERAPALHRLFEDWRALRTLRVVLLRPERGVALR